MCLWFNGAAAEQQQVFGFLIVKEEIRFYCLIYSSPAAELQADDDDDDEGVSTSSPSWLCRGGVALLAQQSGLRRVPALRDHGSVCVHLI